MGKSKPRITKYWVFTLHLKKNAPEQAHYALLGKCGGEGQKCTFITFQRERNEGADHDHFQGYCEFKQTRSMQQVKNYFKEQSMHLEPRAAKTAGEAIVYTTKSDTRVAGPWNAGKVSKSAKSDIKKRIIHEISTHSKTVELIAHEEPEFFFDHGEKLKKLKHALMPPREDPPAIWIFYGPSGVGKTITANRMAKKIAKQSGFKNPCNGMWPGTSKNKWFFPKNYEGQPIVFDEFKHQIRYTQMISLLDAKPWRIEIKGDDCEFNSKDIFITTTIDPREWYSFVKDRSELWRRFEDFCNFVKFEHNTSPFANGPNYTFEKIKLADMPAPRTDRTSATTGAVYDVQGQSVINPLNWDFSK